MSKNIKIMLVFAALVAGTVYLVKRGGLGGCSCGHHHAHHAGHGHDHGHHDH